MKQIYICEKCGAQYEDYDKACQCENGHIDELLSREYAPELHKRYAYKPGERAPGEVVLCSEIWDYEKGEYDYAFFRYKLSGKVSEREVAAIKAEREERRVKEDEENRRWREEWERKQAEREAAKRAEEEASATA